MERPAWELVLVWFGFPIVGAAVGLAIRPVVTWILGRDWLPAPGPLKLIESIPQPLGTIGTVAAGLVLGIVIALIAEGEALRVGVSGDQVTLTRDEKIQTVERSAVGSVFMDGTSLVLAGRAGEELAREKSDLAVDRLAAVFAAHGYQWHPDGDPRRDEYHFWVPGAPELPAGADAVLKARQRALEKGDKNDIADLRTELAKLGVVVRDERKRQYWRRVKIGP